MTKNAKTKTVLLSLIGLLLLIYILQLTLGSRSTVKTLKLSSEADSILIHKTGSEDILLSKEDDKWFVGNKKYAADQNKVQRLYEAVKEVKILNTAAASLGNDAARYGLDEGSVTTVTAQKDGKEIRKIVAGKTTSSGIQSYVMLDGKDSVYVANGNIASIFSVSVEGLRSKAIYSLDENSIEAVSYTGSDGSFTLNKSISGSGKNKTSQWNLTLNSVDEKITQLDNAKVSEWISDLEELNCTSWANENIELPSSNEAVLTLSRKGKTDISVTVHKIENASTYICSSSESPYIFNLSKYSGEKIVKKLSDLQ